MELGELREAFSARDFGAIASSAIGAEGVAWFNRAVESYGVGVCHVARGAVEARELSPLRSVDRVRFCPGERTQNRCEADPKWISWRFRRASMIRFMWNRACIWDLGEVDPQDIRDLSEGEWPCFPCVDTCEAQ